MLQSGESRPARWGCHRTRWHTRGDPLVDPNNVLMGTFLEARDAWNQVMNEWVSNLQCI
jgi:hypothetical protein